MLFRVGSEYIYMFYSHILERKIRRGILQIYNSLVRCQRPVYHFEMARTSNNPIGANVHTLPDFTNPRVVQSHGAQPPSCVQTTPVINYAFMWFYLVITLWISRIFQNYEELRKNPIKTDFYRIYPIFFKKTCYLQKSCSFS